MVLFVWVETEGVMEDTRELCVDRKAKIGYHGHSSRHDDLSKVLPWNQATLNNRIRDFHLLLSVTWVPVITFTKT